MEADSEELGGEPEVTVETVPDNIESGYREVEPGMLSYIQYFLLGYFSNPWALLILAFITYKLYRRLRPFLTEPLADRLWRETGEREGRPDVVLSRYNAWQQQREQQEEAARYKKNPDVYRTKMEVMEAARLKLQEK